jgi:hypothetical protein
MVSSPRKPFRKRLVTASIVAVLGLGLYAFTAIDLRKKNLLLREYKLLADSLQAENERYIQLEAADKLFLVDANYAEALEAYKKLSGGGDSKMAAVLNERIAQVERVLRRPTATDPLKLYESVIAKNANSIDSLKAVISRLNAKTGNVDSLRQKIQALTAEIAQKNKELSRRQLVQVISFKNEAGRLIHYLGEVVNGKANGGGVGIWTTGSLYRGDWKDNKRHGKGTFEWADGMKYVGEFVDDKREGTGNYYWPSGERYEGEWKNDVRDGYGKLFDQDGNIKFEGKWKDDKPSR